MRMVYALSNDMTGRLVSRLPPRLARRPELRPGEPGWLVRGIRHRHRESGRHPGLLDDGVDRVPVQPFVAGLVIPPGSVLVGERLPAAGRLPDQGTAVLEEEARDPGPGEGEVVG